MKVECLKENLVESVAVAEKVTGRNLSLPILSSLLFETKNNTLTIRATNIDLGIEIQVPAKIIKNGVVVVPGNILYNVITSTYGNNTITLELINNNLSISTPTSTTLIKAHPHNDFPTLPIVKDSEPFTLSVKDFIQGLQSVWFSASTSTVKPELASIYIYLNDKKLFFVATDSFRLSEKIIISKNIKHFEPILVPIRNIPEIVRALEYVQDTTVEVSLTENQLSCSSSSVYITSRIIDGVFPDYKQIIPKEFITKVIVLKQDFLQALKKINIFSDKFNQVQLHISSKQKKFILSAHNDEVGETTESLHAALEGGELDINFNHRYLQDSLQSIASDSLLLSLGGVGKPMVIQGVSDNSFLYLVMPMNR